MANQFSEERKINIKFSTPQTYLSDLSKENIEFSVKQNGGDFFPYREHSDDFWTGYYTSRPDLKLLVSQGGKYLQIARNFVYLYLI